MTEQTLPQKACRAVWALLEKGGAWPVHELAEVTGLSDHLVLKYVRLLEENAYLGLSGLVTAVSGESIPTFTLIKRTGRDAPYVDESSAFADPNAPLLRAPTRRSPSISALVRVALEHATAPINLAYVRKSLSGAMSSGRMAREIYQLKQEGCLVEHQGGWQYHPRAAEYKLKQLIKKSLVGQWFTIADLFEEDGDPVPPQSIQRVIHELIAEGYTVTTKRVRRGKSRVSAHTVQLHLNQCPVPYLFTRLTRNV